MNTAITVPVAPITLTGEPLGDVCHRVDLRQLTAQQSAAGLAGVAARRAQNAARNDRIVAMADKGTPYADIGELVGLSEVQVGRIVRESRSRS